MIKNIVFDMGDVLMHFRTQDFVNRYDLTDDEKALLTDVVFGGADWALCDWGYLTEEQVAERACKKLPEKLHEAAWGCAAWNTGKPWRGAGRRSWISAPGSARNKRKTPALCFQRAGALFAFAGQYRLP